MLQNFFFRTGLPHVLKRLALMGLLSLLAALLAGCTTYDGYPTLPPEPTSTPAPPVSPTAAPRPTLAAPPTSTPRPSLPAVPNGVQVTKGDVLKEALNGLISTYYQPLATADIYEVALTSIEMGLRQSGVDPQAKVQLPQFGDKDDANWNLFLQAYSLVVAKYQGKVTEDQLETYALSGAASSLQDCQTSYYPANVAENFLAQRSGQASIIGIGINLQSGTTNNGNAHLVSRVITGGPADKAGLKLGDQILAIDGQDLSTKTSQEVIQLLQGTKQAGSKVSLTIHRGNSASTQTIDITRNSFQVPPMERGTINNNIAYIRISQLPYINSQSQLTTVTNSIAGWFSDFDKAGVTGYILDLRGNSYGSIILVQNILSYFMSGNDLVYLDGELTGQDPENQTGPRQYGAFGMPSAQNIKATDKPVAVLVDGGTSGEAEIFAYAFQLNKRGTVIGEPTAGCANASAPFGLSDKTVLNVTLYRAISDPQKPESILTGVQPDQAVSMDLQQLSQGTDSQLDAAIKALTK
ncbi:MAG: PDZ domain-containing protein [Chloroflexi bacterium]|nr:PDZ domain-containing protein [Chloroflexota bacterium]OJV94421.1 MAG: hypothetical protein BGO39_21920 [Chloroflexi bacterium 54-19]